MLEISRLTDTIEGSAVIYLTASWLFSQIIQYFYQRVQSRKLMSKCSLLAFLFGMVLVALTLLMLQTKWMWVKGQSPIMADGYQEGCGSLVLAFSSGLITIDKLSPQTILKPSLGFGCVSVVEMGPMLIRPLNHNNLATCIRTASKDSR